MLELYADFIREADGPLDPAGSTSRPRSPPGRRRTWRRPTASSCSPALGGEPAGLGGVRHLDTEVAEVKSMYVARAYRGARPRPRTILAELERDRRASAAAAAVRLDTSDYLTAAIALYRAAGYREVADYNDNPKADLWFERALD